MTKKINTTNRKTKNKYWNKMSFFFFFFLIIFCCLNINLWSNFEAVCKAFCNVTLSHVMSNIYLIFPIIEFLNYSVVRRGCMIISAIIIRSKEGEKNIHSKWYLHWRNSDKKNLKKNSPKNKHLASGYSYDALKRTIYLR